MLYDDHDRAAARALRLSPVAKAPRSPVARHKYAAGATDDGLRVHSSHSLFAPDRTLYPRLTPLQHKAFDLLGFDPTRTQ